MFGFPKKARWVADYCVICRDLQRHRLLVASKNAQFPNYPDIECESCGVRSRVHASRYLRADTQRHERFEDLMTSTFPTLPLDCTGRVMWELDAIGGRLTPPDRFLAIQEPFEIVSYLTNSRRKNVFLVAIGGVICMGLAAGLVNALFSSIPALPSNPAVLKPIFAIACLAGAVVPLLISDWRGRRKASARMQPILARSLRPLLPSIEELEAIRHWATTKKLPIRRYIKVQPLRALIDRIPDTSLINADELQVLELAEDMRVNRTDPNDGQVQVEADREDRREGH